MKRITFFAILLCGILGLTSQYTHAETGTLCSYYDGSSDSGSFYESYGGGTLEDVIEDGKPCFKFTNDQAKEDIWDIAVFIDANFKEDYLYTVSFDIKGDPGKFQMGNPLYNSDPINVTSGWSRITFQCKSGRNAEYTSFQLGRYVGTLYITNFVITYESPFDPSEPARSIISNGDCSTDDVSCFFSNPGNTITVPATIDQEASAYRVDIPENKSGVTWDSRFFIKSNHQLPAGTPISFKMKVKCTDARYCSIQAHKNSPGNYVHYSFLGGGFTTEADEWTEYSWTGEVQREAGLCDIAAFILSENPDAATIWFKDIEWMAGSMEGPEDPEVPNEGLLASWVGNWPLYSTGEGHSYVNCWQLNISNMFICKVDGIGICDQPDEFKHLYGILSGKRPTPGKTYKLTFDIAGKAPAEGIPVTIGNGIISNEFSSTFDITTEWQRVTLEITPTDEDLYKLDFILDKYEGTFYITNIYLYDALFTPNLPEIPTINHKTIPSWIKVAMPVAIGESLPIHFVIDAEESTPLNWRSSDESVAIVADGIVTGVAKGQARISISSDINAYASEDLIVEVYEPDPVIVPVSTITIDPMVIDDAKVGDQIRLTANVMPENADDKSVTWSSSKEEVATVDESGLVTIVAPGTAVITATANDGNGAKGVCLISGMSGIEDIVYSSPNEPKNIYTIDGKLIMRRATRDDINRLSQGVYLIGNQKIAIR